MFGQDIIYNIVPLNMETRISLPGLSLAFRTGKTFNEVQDFIAGAGFDIENLFAFSTP
jgi:hypothetical protein